MKTVQEVHDVLKQAERDYRAWAQATRQRIDLDKATRDAGATDYEHRAAKCAEAAVLIEKANIT